jgi:hypothetical protein
LPRPLFTLESIPDNVPWENESSERMERGGWETHGNRESETK